MLDCLFETSRHLHLHVAEERNSATLVSRYQPGMRASHAEDLRQGLESEGRLIAPEGGRFRLELFLLNDRFGEKPGEVVMVQVDGDGRSRIEARNPQGRIRLLDFGTCSDRAPGGR